MAWRGACDRTRLTDVSLLAALGLLTIVAQPHLIAPATLVSVDTASQYYPWYAFLGQTLRAGNIPGWNPTMFAGAPFAADPLSGWTYVPAMVLFAALPLEYAAKTMLVFHPLLAAGSAYALARVLGLGHAPAFIAGLAYANSGFVQIQNLCCSPVASIYGWLPLTLVGVERALRSRRWRRRLGWWGLAALGISQSVAVWPGQGAYYAALIVGGYIAFLSLVAPAENGPRPARAGPTSRIGQVLLHEGGVFAFAAALAAAGVLPRLEFNALSNLAGGYAGDNLGVGGLQPAQWLYLASPSTWYVGVSILALAVAAPLVGRRWLTPSVGYFGVTSLGALLLTGTAETPLHWLLYRLLPGFASLHPHAPERILTVAFLGPALLAGVCVQAIGASKWSPRRTVTLGVMAIVITTDLALGGAKARGDRLLIDPLDGIERLTPVDLATYYQPTLAAAFLEQRQAQSPARFLGYAPDVNGRPLAYTFRFVDPSTAALLVNNRALTLGLHDVQGYDASHLQRYDDYMAALNGQTQNYHDATIFARGLSSPLLDLLNVRYLVVPQHIDALDAPALARFWNTTVYEDGHVRIVENPSAFPRAWIVHEAVPAPPGSRTSTESIARGSIDARRTAVLEVEEAPPSLEVVDDAAQDQATVVTDEPNRIEVHTSSDAAGLLVLSEIAYPAWQAYIDGRPVRQYIADGTLRSVPVPAGEHLVALRFESKTLQIGLIVSSIALLVLGSLALVCAWERRGSSS